MTRGPNEDAQFRLRAAIGQAVLLAAALEHTLLVVILRLRAERDGADDHLASAILSLSQQSAGNLRRELEELAFDPGMISRIGDVIRRRNRLIHHPGEDAVLTPALAGGDPQRAIAQVDRLASDCETLVSELANEYPKALEAVNMSPQQLEDLLENPELADISDDRLRAGIAVARDILRPRDGSTDPDRDSPDRPL